MNFVVQRSIDANRLTAWCFSCFDTW